MTGGGRKMLLNAIIGLFAAVGLFFLLQLIKQTVYRPVPVGENTRISVVLNVSGCAEELEQSVKALRWLLENGGVDADLIIRNCGMDDETALVARKLSETGGIKLIN